MVSIEFGTYLKRLRKANSLTLKDVESMVDISHSYLSQVENGRRGANPSPEMLRKLSSAFGVTQIGLLIAAGYITEEEVLTFRQKAGIYDLVKGESENE